MKKCVASFTQKCASNQQYRTDILKKVCKSVTVSSNPGLWLTSFLRTTMYSKGTKRKFADGADAVAGGNPEGPKMAPYSLQRQSLLDMSLIKLQLCHMLVEPNLCRSVLIANTVRQIQEEMTHDGSWQVVTDAFASSGQSSSERLVATEVLCRSSGDRKSVV